MTQKDRGQTLRAMESERLVNIAVVDGDNKFKFITSRDGIVASGIRTD